MSYIGRQLNNLSDRVKLDSITASATATYNLLLNTVAYVPSSAESLTVSLNGVIQAPQDSYTVSGSTITFASTLSASDSIDFILAERSITLQTPSAGSVGTSQLAADAVNGDKIADDSISDEHLDITAITGQTAITSLADTDKFLVSDASDSGNLKYVEKQYLPSGGLVLLQTVTASNSATVDISGNFSSTYDNYIIYFNNVRMASAPDYFGARILTPSGSGTYWAASTNYGTVKIARRITGDGTSNDESTGDSQYDRIPMTVSTLENNGDWDIRGYVNIPYPLTSSYKYVEFMTLAGCPDDSALMTYSTGAANLYKNDNLTGIQFLGENGNVNTGTFKLYGIVK